MRFRILLLLFLGCARSLVAQPAGKAFVDSVLAVPYDVLVGDLNTSYTTLHRALLATRGSSDRIAEGRVCGKLAVVHHLLNQLDSSTYYGLKAVDLFREAGDRVLLGDALCSLGHEVKGSDLPQAFVYYRQGLSMLEAEQALAALTGSYDNFGVVHALNNDGDSALFYYRKALALKEQLHDSIGIPYSLNKIAVALLPQGRFEEALALMQRADTIRHAINDRMGLADQPVYFGDLYQAWGRYAEAIAQFTIGIERSVAVAFPYLRQYSFERIAECHEALGDHRAALAATKRATQVRDSIQGANTTRTILELKERFNAAEKDRAIALLNERAARRQLYTWLSLIALVLVVVIGLYLHQLRQRRVRAERDAAIIREREAGLKAVFQATEEERRRLARELHDGVGQQLGGLKHRLEHLRAQADTDAVNETITIVDDTAREVRDLAHQLMPKALSRLGLVPALEDLVQRTFSGTAITASFEPFAVPDELPVDMTTGLYRITQELLNNILKHAQAGTVEVQLLGNRGHVVLIVQDNGRGVQAGKAAPGIGLLNIADRVRALNGTFALESTPGQGTAATVRVPITPAT
jgi:signal transduction histidine kinase